MDFLYLVVEWLLSSLGAILVLVSVLLAALAIRLSPIRATGRFLLVLTALWLAFSAWSAVESLGIRSALAGVLWGLGVLGLYALVLSPLVARAKPPGVIAAVSVALLAFQLPFSLLAGLYLGCYVGHDCP
jgi:hypothetical protein